MYKAEDFYEGQKIYFTDRQRKIQVGEVREILTHRKTGKVHLFLRVHLVSNFPSACWITADRDYLTDEEVKLLSAVKEI